MTLIPASFSTILFSSRIVRSLKFKNIGSEQIVYSLDEFAQGRRGPKHTGRWIPIKGHIQRRFLATVDNLYTVDQFLISHQWNNVARIPSKDITAMITDLAWPKGNPSTNQPNIPTCTSMWKPVDLLIVRRIRVAKPDEPKIFL